MSTKAVMGGLLIDGISPEPLKDPVVLIEDSQIIQVLTQAEYRAGGELATEVFDLRSKAILPGLIDPHVHLMFYPGPDHEAGMATFELDVQKDMLPFRVVRNAQEALRGGITTLRDSGDYQFITQAYKEAVEANLLDGPRLLTSGMPITTTEGHLCFCGLQADTEAEIRGAVQLLCDRGVDSIKVMATGGTMGDNNPLGVQYSLEQMRALVEEAHQHDKPVEAHATNTPGIEVCVEAGVDHIAHCVWWNAERELDYRPDLVDMMVCQGTVVEMTVSGFFRRWLPTADDTNNEREDKLREMRDFYAPMRDMRKAGVKLIVHTDAGVRLTDFGALAQGLRLMHLALQITPMEVIQTATAHAAVALGIDDSVGSIAPGKQADLIVVDMNPLEDIQRLMDVSLVMKGGRSVVADGLFVSK